MEVLNDQEKQIRPLEILNTELKLIIDYYEESLHETT